MRKYLSFIILTLSLQLMAQEKWDVNNPPGESKEVNFEVSEGTWMNLDVSPDGKTIAFDLLGDIYTIPIDGGEATALRQGLAWEVQPRFSPDGRKILFTSDAGGGDNIWHMSTDGSDARQITKESFRLVNNAVWTPDGEYVMARKHFTSTRSLGAGEIWMYHITGGDGVQLSKRKNDQQDVNEPCVSPDGRYLYYSEDEYPGGYFQYNKDPNDQIFVIYQYDRETGKRTKVTGGPGGAVRPQISSDGRRLAYVRRDRTKSVLYVHELETGRETRLYENLSKDQQEAWTTFGIYPGFDWTPDDKHIVIWANGKIMKINSASGDAVEIPFSAKAKHTLMETVKFTNKAYEDKMKVKVLRGLKTSPDGKHIVFNALGKLWITKGINGTPKRLTKSNDFEAEPSFSHDGKSIVYVSWTDENYGAIKTVNLDGSNGKALTTKPAIYRTPAFSPDGTQVVYRKEGGNSHMGYTYAKNPGIYILDVVNPTKEHRFVTANGEYPMFNSEGNKLYLTEGGYIFGSIKKSMTSYDLEKEKLETVFNTKYTTQFTPSPDNKWIAFTELYKVYIAPFPKTGKPFGLSAKTKAVPVVQVAKDAGINLHWSKDSKSLNWTLGNEYFSTDLTDKFMFLEGARDSITPVDSVGQVITLEVPMDKPSQQVAITNCKIITMEGDQVIDNGLIITNDNLITYVGAYDSGLVNRNMLTIDARGKTVMPGIIDVHAHLGAFRGGISPEKHWEYYTNLAFGVTTTHDPSVNTEITFAQSEMVKSGAMIGPRIFSTGTILYGADGDFKAEINSLEDAKSALRRTKAYGAFSVKSYNQPRREQRQQVIEAARQLGIRVVPEGGSFFYHNMTQVADGHTSVEHNIPVAPLYDDVIKFWSNTGTSNTPTLIVNYGGVNGEYYWYQNTNVWENEKLMKYTPKPIVDSRSRHRTMIPDEEYENGYILTSKSCNDLQNAGVNINLGAHGQLQGLGAHWELWMLEQGGMSNIQALRSATMNGAELLGMEAQLGSLKKGKLADLIIIDGDPLSNIKDTENVIYTMINGRVYDTATMNELGGNEKKRSRFYWEMDGVSQNYPFYPSTQSFMQPKCHCRM